jgi:hypothetical protein
MYTTGTVPRQRRSGLRPLARSASAGNLLADGVPSPNASRDNNGSGPPAQPSDSSLVRSPPSAEEMFTASLSPEQRVAFAQLQQRPMHVATERAERATTRAMEDIANQLRTLALPTSQVQPSPNITLADLAGNVGSNLASAARVNPLDDLANVTNGNIAAMFPQLEQAAKATVEAGVMAAQSNVHLPSGEPSMFSSLPTCPYPEHFSSQRHQCSAAFTGQLIIDSASGALSTQPARGKISCLPTSSSKELNDHQLRLAFPTEQAYWKAVAFLRQALIKQQILSTAELSAFDGHVEAMHELLEQLVEKAGAWEQGTLAFFKVHRQLLKRAWESGASFAANGGQIAPFIVSQAQADLSVTVRLASLTGGLAAAAVGVGPRAGGTARSGGGGAGSSQGPRLVDLLPPEAKGKACAMWHVYGHCTKEGCRYSHACVVCGGKHAGASCNEGPGGAAGQGQRGAQGGNGGGRRA